MKKFRRVAAIIGIVLLLGMYAAAFILSFFRSPDAQAWFRGAIGCTIIVPVFLYVVMMMARLLKPRRSELFDGVIFADARVLKEKDGSDMYFAADWQKEFHRKGYRMYHFMGETAGLSDYLEDLIRKEQIKASRYLYIDTDKEAVSIAKKRQFAAIQFTSFPDVTEKLESLGVVL